MKIELEIGKYNENKDLGDFQKMLFSTIDEAIATVDFLKMGYHFFKNDESLMVRVENGAKPHLLDYSSTIPLKELRQELEEKYDIKPLKNEIEDEKTPKKKKESLNSNFSFSEDDQTLYAKTSTGKNLPFKLFRSDDTGRKSNLLWESQNSRENTDFALLERRFTEFKSLEFFGNEKIKSRDDIAWLFQSLEDEAVEHAFLVYDFEDKGYFVQHISTGSYTATLVDNKQIIGNVIEANPKSITFVHNHPSGSLRASNADLNVLKNIKQALKNTDITVNDGIIINLRSGNYLVFNEKELHLEEERKKRNEPLTSIQAYSFSKQILVENFQPIKVRNEVDIAAYITSQKFGVSDKTEMLVLNNKLNILGKFILPNNNQLNTIIEKLGKFGGSNCILFGNNITPELVNFYNKQLEFSSMRIVDALLLKSENGQKMWESFFAEGKIKESSQISVNAVSEYNNQKYLQLENQNFKNKKFFHETNFEKLQKFDLNFVGSGQGENWLGKGIYLQEDKSFKIESYGKLKVEVELNQNAKIFCAKEPKNKDYRDSFVEWAVENTEVGKRKAQERLDNGLSLDNLLPRDILRSNPEAVEKLKSEGYDGFYQDGELVIYNTNVLKMKKENQSSIETQKEFNQIKFDDKEELLKSEIFKTYLTSLTIDNSREMRDRYFNSLSNEHKEYVLKPENFSEIYNNVISILEVKNFDVDNSTAKKLANFLANEIIIQRNNQKYYNVNMETQKEFNQTLYLKNQLKYLGFGESEQLHKDLESGINSNEKQFEIITTSDKTLPGNKVDFNLRFGRSENGNVYFNSFDAQLKNDKLESFLQNFKVTKENTFTAKEVVNLLEGRSVKIEFNNPKTEQKENAFVKLDMINEKNQYGNYNFQTFHQNYGVDTQQIVEKSNLIFDKPEYKESTIKSLEKGNVVKAKFELDGKVIEGKAVLNPQYKNLSLYDNEMNRMNTNKPIQGMENENKSEKANVREQSISRGI